MTYIVRVDDNFHYMDKDARYTHGEYATFDEALQAAKEIVDGYLSSAYTPGMSAEDLYLSYTSIGDDPFIVGPEDSNFSAWSYAKERCSVICGGGTPDDDGGQPACRAVHNKPAPIPHKE
jgi:hypothetical protein